MDEPDPFFTTDWMKLSEVLQSKRRAGLLLNLATFLALLLRKCVD
jgi:hypothetical protein